MGRGNGARGPLAGEACLPQRSGVWRDLALCRMVAHSGQSDGPADCLSSLEQRSGDVHSTALPHRLRFRVPGYAPELAGSMAAAAVCVVAVMVVGAASPAEDRFQRTLLEGLIVGLP